VRTIAEAHGGEAGAANLPSGGADVWLRIPIALQPSSLTLEPSPI
jgi:signal transduction histidine kinase